MKSTWFGKRERYDFASCLQDADYTRQPSELFRIWLTCAHAAFRQPVEKLLCGKINQSIEDEYEQTRAKVRKPEKLAEAMAILTQGLENNAHDFLGCVAGEWGLLNTEQAQFFTPESVCDLLAGLVIGDASPRDGHTLTLSEPSCGAGATIISATKMLWDRGFYPWHYHWTAIDVDWRMFATCYVQLSLLGIPAAVIHGNTLTLETFDSARTIVGVIHPAKTKAVLPDDSRSSVTLGNESVGLPEFDAKPTLAPGMLF